jgi:hypothetical protein
MDYHGIFACSWGVSTREGIINEDMKRDSG